MSKVERKNVTVVSVSHDLDVVGVGEKLFIQHDEGNEFDKNALKVFRQNEDIGYVAKSSHTVQKGCVPNDAIVDHIPSKDVPLLGTVINKVELQYKNGDIVKALIVAVNVVKKEVGQM